MSLSQIKKKIKDLVNAETDERKLGRVLTVLDREISTKAVAKRMQQVAEASERDVKAGRVMDLEAFEMDTASFLNELFERKKKGRTVQST